MDDAWFVGAVNGDQPGFARGGRDAPFLGGQRFEGDPDAALFQRFKLHRQGPGLGGGGGRKNDEHGEFPLDPRHGGILQVTAQADAQQVATRQWVETALRTHGETTADTLFQWMSWMEQQRQQDVQRMEAGFQQMLDRDFQTVDSVRQLASYVMYQEAP